MTGDAPVRTCTSELASVGLDVRDRPLAERPASGLFVCIMLLMLDSCACFFCSSDDADVRVFDMAEADRGFCRGGLSGVIAWPIE